MKQKWLLLFLRFFSKFVEFYKERFGCRLVSAGARKVHVMQFHDLIFAKLKHAVLFQIEYNSSRQFLLAVLFSLLLCLDRLHFRQLWNFLVGNCVFQRL